MEPRLSEQPLPARRPWVPPVLTRHASLTALTQVPVAGVSMLFFQGQSPDCQLNPSLCV
jgi:hypothetical protein